ncbi:MAG: hypothetical protein P4L64_09860 [Caulobacteraceae bacterium]|nr:hypothetical protein [Caulobacteraceae bacterium]
MKKLLIASVAALATLVAAPALAASGQVDIGYHGADGLGSGNNLNDVVFGGAVATQFSGEWGGQFDAHFERIDGAGERTTLSTGTAHLFKRNDSYLVGAYASVADVLGAGLYAGGIEGQKYFDRATLYGTVGYGTSDFRNNNVTAWNVAADAKGFITDNLTVDLKVDYTDGQQNLNGHVTTYGVGAEWKPEGHPFSLFAEYARHAPSGRSFGLTSISDYNTYGVGFRWNFGVKTLKERDRSGASLRTGSFLSDAFLN